MADVVSPYDRNGAGDYFYILGDSKQVPLFRGEQTHSSQPLRGLGMFAGGGNFDGGLEEGGAVKFKYALDWAEHALHSYRANLVDPDSVQYFLGSVNDYLAKAIKDSPAIEIAQAGDVQLISGGSPCPGFSNLQPDKQSPKSLQIASMVASVVAFVDLYSPKYLILENVVTMTTSMGDNKDQIVFSQILAALVALGYQTQQFLMDAWSYGSSQCRSRVFIIASAPGLKPIVAPPHTHGHSDHRVFKTRRVGKQSNGMPFGIRRNDYTVFDCTSAQQATSDLPCIFDAMPQLCPRFPDHRTSTDQEFDVCQRMARIPTRLCGMGLAKAVANGYITSGEAYEFWRNGNALARTTASSSYTRVKPHDLFPTVVTRITVRCAKNGVTLHWDEHRTLSIMKGRRAQGFLDHEVIVGSPGQQWVIIGNSVDRHVSFALGLALKKSWMSSADDDEAEGTVDPAKATRDVSFTRESTDELQRTGPTPMRHSDVQDIPNRTSQLAREYAETRKPGRRPMLPCGIARSAGTSAASTLRASQIDNGLLTPMQDEE